MCEGCVQEGHVSQRVFELINAFCCWAMETGQSDPDFGMGHIVFADYNVEDHHIEHCLGPTQEGIRPLSEQERRFLETLLLIPEPRRVPNFYADRREDSLNITNVTPMGARVLVKRLAAEPLKSSIIEVVQMHDDPGQQAVVLAVGDLKQGGIEIGDTVVTKSFAGAPLEVLVEGQVIEAFMLMESDCLAVIE